MAGDPARPKKITFMEARKAHQQACKNVPCTGMLNWKPRCPICVHEGALIKHYKELENE